VKEIEKTAEFYEKLGFTIHSMNQNHLSVGIEHFWIDFLRQDREEKKEFQKEAHMQTKGGGQFVYIAVDSVDEFYEYIKGRGLEPKYDPRDWSWGNREFMLRDPDGYKLVFFQKLANGNTATE